jgi:hypothetical protein
MLGVRGEEIVARSSALLLGKTRGLLNKVVHKATRLHHYRLVLQLKINRYAIIPYIQLENTYDSRYKANRYSREASSNESSAR